MSGSGGSALQRYLHAALLLVHSLLCGGTVMVLRMRGRHVRYIVNHYQELASSYLILIFYFALFESVLREQRRPGSLSGTDTCMLVGYAVVLASARLHWQWVVMAMGLDIVGVVFAGIWVGLSQTTMQRVFACVLFSGGCATYLSYCRVIH